MYLFVQKHHYDVDGATVKIVKLTKSLHTFVSEMFFFSPFSFLRLTVSVICAHNDGHAYHHYVSMCAIVHRSYC